MKLRNRFSYFFWYFIHFKVPLISKVKPKIVLLNEEQLVIKIPLSYRSRNHLHSMYFGALAIGADLAGGLHAFYLANAINLPIKLAFKSFSIQFLKRAEQDVYFVCHDGAMISQMLQEAFSTKTRVTRAITVNAFTNYPDASELVASSTLELSIKI